ncbi:MAG: hypothetical protein ACRDTJ_30420, partial [Pseudonocardiaceae bacterium]
MDGLVKFCQFPRDKRPEISRAEEWGTPFGAVSSAHGGRSIQHSEHGALADHSGAVIEDCALDPL